MDAMDSELQPDINQLPIPDWDLGCPRCGYSLRHLPEHRCPECGTRFSMDDIVRTWTRTRAARFSGEELPVPDFGLECRRCGGPLAGATGPTCPQCGAPFDLPARRPTRPWLAVTASMCDPLPVPIVESVLAADGVPFLPQEARSIFDIILGTRLTDMMLFVPREFYFDACWLIRRAKREAAERRAAGEEEEWECPACGEPNPAHFAVCWNCAGGDQSEQEGPGGADGE